MKYVEFPWIRKLREANNQNLTNSYSAALGNNTYPESLGKTCPCCGQLLYNNPLQIQMYNNNIDFQNNFCIQIPNLLTLGGLL